ncbi:protein NRT1/ PTR FAMILY 4.2-like [Vicia villosa]|uniref:protein NRT1/ PTR FAMILY 4.2-like n=1 Tax=Vicia villosa TaxID=3911 RepID=UPI00273C62A7|nr:protein NRT1/ PTR FAMILY 4.2-like [Vicia villosa]
MQSNFLWGGSEEKRKMHWVSWNDLCLPVEKGGLGVRNLEDFNNALPLKWNWRIFGASNTLWYRILKARYVDVKLRDTLCVKNKSKDWSSSVWWADISSMENKIPADFFANNCFFHVGIGHSISFWHAHWLEDGILKDLLPYLYIVSVLQDASIGAMGGWKDGCWTWGDLGIATATDFLAAAPVSNGTAAAPNSDGSAATTNSFVLPTVLVTPGSAASLAHLLSLFDLKLDQQDSAYWKHEDDGVYSVSSCYYALSRRYIPFGPANRHDTVFEDIWKEEVPLKVKAFGWRSFLIKIPTKDMLLNRGILNSSSSLDCVFCEEVDETLLHSFSLCHNVAIVWKEMAEWIGLDYNCFDNFKENLWYWSNFCRAKKVKRGNEGIVWLAIIWSIWLHRNDIVFNISSWNSRDVDSELSNMGSGEYTDYKGKTADPRKHGGIRAASFACVVEIMQCLVISGNAMTLVNYFLKSMHYSVADSSNMVTNFMGTAFVLTLIWGFISDSYITRFTTFVLSNVLHILGLLMLTYQSQNPNLQPPENKTPSYIQALFLYTGLYATSIGVGGIRSTLAAHGADQLDQNNKILISSYFSWYFFSLCTGGLLATSVMVSIEQKYGWSTSFMIMVFVSSLALCTFVSGFSLYRYKRPAGSSVTRIIQVIYIFVLAASMRNIKVSTVGCLNRDVIEQLLPREQTREKFKFLNKALMDQNIDVAQVKETKTFLGLLPIFLTTIMMNCSVAQILTFSVQQGNLMNRKLYNFEIPAQSIAVIPIIISLTFIIIFEQFKHMNKNKGTTTNNKIYQPLFRMGIGLVLVSISMFVASIIEFKRLEAFKNGNMLSLFWLTFQYTLLGLSDTLTLGGMLEFFYSESPESMRSICTSLSWCSSAMGMFVSSLLVSISNSVSRRFGMEWFGGKDLNHSRLDFFYALLCGINFFNFSIYVYFAKRY